MVLFHRLLGMSDVPLTHSIHQLAVFGGTGVLGDREHMFRLGIGRLINILLLLDQVEDEGGGDEAMWMMIEIGEDSRA